MGGRRSFQFDRFQVDPLHRVLLDEGRPVSILPKSFSALLLFLEQPGTVIPKETLMARLWPDTVVTEASLSQTIFWLRKALGSRPDGGKYIVTVPGSGYSLTAQVQVLDEAGGSPAPAESPTAPEVPDHLPKEGRPWARPALALCTGVLLLGLSSLLYFFWPGSSSSVPREAPRPVVAVLGLRHLSGHPDTIWMGAALPEMLITEISAGARVRVIPAEVVSRSRVSLDLSSEALGPAALERFHQLLGADHLVTGSFVVVDEGPDRRVRVDLRLLTIPRGELAASFSEEGTEARLFDLAGRLGARLRQALGAPGLSADQERAARAAHPASPEAARYYAEGLAALRNFNARGARDLLEKAVAADPQSALLRSGLAQAWSTLGYDHRAAEQAGEALRLASPLSREDRLLIEGRAAETDKRWTKASESYRSLWSFYPDDLEYGLLLAGSLTNGGKGKDALEVVASLRRLSGQAAQDPRLDLAEAAAASALADYERQLRAGRAAAAKAGPGGAEPIVAVGLWHEATALRSLGQRQEALALLARVESICSRAGDRGGVAEALSQSGLIARELGEMDKAQDLYDRALATFRDIGYRRATATLLANLGVLQMYQGKWGQARRSFEEARTAYRDIGDQVGAAGVLASMVGLLSSQGDYEPALQAAREMLELSRETGNRDNEAGGLRNLGWVQAELGNLRSARPLLDQGRRILEQLGDGSKAAAMRCMLASVDFRLGKTAGARAAATDALEAKQRFRDKLGAASAINLLVPMLLEEGAVAEARRLAEEQLRVAALAHTPPLQASARHNLGTVQLAAGETAAARSQLQQALDARIKLGQVAAAETTRLELARAALAENDAEQCLSLATAVLAAARRLRLPDLQAAALAVAAEARIKITGARTLPEEAGQAQSLIHGREDTLAAVRVAVALGRVEAAAGDPARAARDLEAAESAAETAGFTRSLLEARCARGQALWRGGDRAGASLLLDRTRSAAAGMGLGRVAGGCLPPADSPR